MADRSPAPDTPELRERWGGFEFTEAYRAKAEALGPQGRSYKGLALLGLGTFYDYLGENASAAENRRISIIMLNESVSSGSVNSSVTP